MSKDKLNVDNELAWPPAEIKLCKAMKRDKIIGYLKALRTIEDEEVAHLWADEALLNYIGDPEITEAFGAVPKYDA